MSRAIRIAAASAALALAVATAAFAQREPVLKQIDLPHNYYFREMTNAGKANSLYYNERYAGDWRRAFSYDAIQSVDKESVQRAFRKYAKNLQVGIVGKQSAVTPVRFQYANSLPVY